MTTIADCLGISWAPQAGTYHLTHHAQKQARAKGWTEKDVLMAAEQPLHTYPSMRVPGQVRHVRGNLVAIVDPAEHKVVTVYADQVQTALRPDQTDVDAQRYARHQNR